MSKAVKIRGLNKLENDLVKYSLLKKLQVKALIQITALNIESTAKKIVPIKDNGLRSSIRMMYKSLDGLSVSVGTNIKYAAYIEYGTPIGTGPNGGPKPYLNPALEEQRPKYFKELKKILKSTK